MQLQRCRNKPPRHRQSPAGKLLECVVNIIETTLLRRRVALLLKQHIRIKRGCRERTRRHPQPAQEGGGGSGAHEGERGDDGEAGVEGVVLLGLREVRTGFRWVYGMYLPRPVQVDDVVARGDVDVAAARCVINTRFL
jgi:hypothetical protein